MEALWGNQKIEKRSKESCGVNEKIRKLKSLVTKKFPQKLSTIPIDNFQECTKERKQQKTRNCRWYEEIRQKLSTNQINNFHLG